MFPVETLTTDFQEFVGDIERDEEKFQESEKKQHQFGHLHLTKETKDMVKVGKFFADGVVASAETAGGGIAKAVKRTKWTPYDGESKL